MPIDYKKYPPDWKTKIRPRILERSGGRCEFCGVQNHSMQIRNLGTPKKKWIKIVLTIAHLDHDETNWDVKDERLKALCQRCHIGYDAKEKAKRRKLKTKNMNQNEMEF